MATGIPAFADAFVAVADVAEAVDALAGAVVDDAVAALAVVAAAALALTAA